MSVRTRIHRLAIALTCTTLGLVVTDAAASNKGSGPRAAAGASAPSPAASAHEEEIVKSVAAGRFALEVSGQHLYVPFDSNRPIDLPAAFTRLVFYIHGSHR